MIQFGKRKASSPAPAAQTVGATTRTAAATIPASSAGQGAASHQKLYATILFDRPCQIDGRRLAKAVQAHFPSKLYQAEYRGQPGPGLEAIGIGHAGLVVGAINERIDNPHVQASLKSNWMWPEADAAVRAHRASIMIVGMLRPSEGPQPRQFESVMMASFGMTILAATCLLELPGALAVVWHSANRISKPQAVVRSAEQCASGSIDPSPWIEVTAVRTSATPPELCAQTKGLAPFFGGELAYVPEVLPLQDVLARVHWTARYLVLNGLPANNRMTLPLTETEAVEILVGPPKGEDEPFIYVSSAGNR